MKFNGSSDTTGGNGPSNCEVYATAISEIGREIVCFSFREVAQTDRAHGDGIFGAAEGPH